MGGEAQDAFKRERQARLAYTLARYLRAGGGVHRFEEHIGGDGSGVSNGRLGLNIEVDHSTFWRMYSEVSAERAWS